ncbi:hypothetical protein ALC62_14299 [Cyphomyrmex costatus]|uniref:Uncharacterized protein n=1 Tax=Cyphomyrmex costatus TaxID=456900 RepID=A0A151I8W4_9HYME|nr:hypothetical protein ALC62_14299 [Cyphomyrmex costatus]
MDPMDSGRRRKPSAQLSCTGWSTGWKRPRVTELGTVRREVVIGKSDGGSKDEDYRICDSLARE